jgi:hypothetical protein
VAISYAANHDPERFGFDLLGLDFPTETARGFPVIKAEATLSREGYAALLGWVQVVDFVVTHNGVAGEPEWVVPDVPPQLRDANTPYFAFGINPVLFDAPAFTERNVDWTARSFLTYTPDCLMTPALEPLCGLRWGYVIDEGAVRIKQLEAAGSQDWLSARRLLRIRLPTWKVGGDKWDPPSLS